MASAKLESKRRDLSDEISNIANKTFTDIAWAYNKNISLSGPSTDLQCKQIQRSVLKSSTVTDTIQSIHQNTGIAIPRLKREASKMFDSLNSQFNQSTMKFMAYTVRKFWQASYDGIFINPKGIQIIKDAGRYAIVLLILIACLINVNSKSLILF